MNESIEIHVLHCIKVHTKYMWDVTSVHLSLFVGTSILHLILWINSIDKSTGQIRRNLIPSLTVMNSATALCVPKRYKENGFHNDCKASQWI